MSPPLRDPSSRLSSLPAIADLPMPLRALVDEAGAASGQMTAEAFDLLADTLRSLTLLAADGEVVAATVLHDLTIADALQAQVEGGASAGVAALLDGQRAARQVWTLHAEHDVSGNAEGLRRLLLAIVRDLRVVPILLARQLAQLRAAALLPDEERRELAQLTRDIHAPLANRLGIWQLKWELEDLAFRHLEPDTYRRIARLLDDKRVGRETYIAQVTRELDDALREQGLDADVAGRPKHIYSIWKKMQKKNVPIGELYDLRAVRILVDDVPDCYAALGAVHALWAPVPGEFDDYIARPKHNDYRSLHTAVVGPQGKTLEVQVRTREMHAQAELGVAAHWRYKEDAYDGRGGSKRSAAGNAANDRKIEWMRRLLETHADPAKTGTGDLAGDLDTELVEDRIYVLTPRGEVIDLPRGATPLDFAYQVHTEVGHRCRGAKVDGRIVTLDHRLQSGDQVEILTAKVGEPRRDWLIAANGFLASARSREKVRNWFHRLDRARNLQAGKDLLDRELKRLGLQHADPAPALQKFNAASLEDLQVQVALGDVGPHQVGRALLEHIESRRQHEIESRRQRGFESRHQRDEVCNSSSHSDIVPRAPRRALRTAPSAFTVVGVDNLLVHTARCCHPVPGDAVAGYLTQGRGVTVHRADCAAFLRLSAAQPRRVLPVEFGSTGGGHEAGITIDAIDRKYLLKDLTDLMAQEDTHVLSIRSDSGRRGGLRLHLQLRVKDYGQLSRLLGRVDSLPGVQSARRV